jgi:hypothetical protein
MRSGCVSGMVRELIYCEDTKEFYIKFMDEIHELVDEMEESTGEAIKTEGNRANWLAWFGYEAMARQIFDEIGIEY